MTDKNAECDSMFLRRVCTQSRMQAAEEREKQRKFKESRREGRQRDSVHKQRSITEQKMYDDMMWAVRQEKRAEEAALHMGAVHSVAVSRPGSRRRVVKKTETQIEEEYRRILRRRKKR